MTKIYIIHGWSYNLDRWNNIKLELKMRDVEPVFLKVPGLTEPSDKVWTIDGYIDWLTDKLKGESAPIVVGHSNGGRIAMSYIQKHPNHIKKLILIDSAGVAHNEPTSVLKLKTLKYLSKLGKPLAAIPPLRKIFYRVIGARDYLDAPPNMRQTMANMHKADQKINFAHIKLPVTIIWGRDDTITPLSDGQKINAGIAKSKLVVIDGARHAPMETHSEQVADIIEAVAKGKK
jgi:pimeloyl-ACP methyl ester carboxylesterase